MSAELSDHRTRPNGMRTIAVFLTVAFLVACTDDSQDAQPSETTEVSGCDLEGLGTAADEFVGLTETDARARAERQDLLFNVVSRNGAPCAPSLADINPDRLNVAVRNGLVASASRW